MSTAVLREPISAAGDERSALEDAAIYLLGGLKHEHGGYLVALDPYNGELASPDLDDLERELSGRTPAILVAAGSASFDSEGTSKRRARGVYTLELLVVSRGLRSRAARTRGDLAAGEDADGDPGCYRMLRDVRDRLWGVDLGVAGATAASLESESPAVIAPELSAWVAIYTTTFRIKQASEADRALTPMSSIVHRHNQPTPEPTNPVVEGEVQ